jgi:hypothetical protein
MRRIDRMSRRELMFASLVIAVLLTACRDPVSTRDISAELSPPLFAAQQDWVRSSFNVDQVVFVSCLGENVRFFGTVPFQYHTVLTPSGTFDTKFQLRPGAVSPPFFGQGLTSGTLYKFRGGPYNETFHSAAGEVFRFKTKESYIAENGDRLEGDAFLHVTTNANGEVTVQRIEPFAFTCRSR